MKSIHEANFADAVAGRVRFTGEWPLWSVAVTGPFDPPFVPRFKNAEEFGDWLMMHEKTAEATGGTGADHVLHYARELRELVKQSPVDGWSVARAAVLMRSWYVDMYREPFIASLKSRPSSPLNAIIPHLRPTSKDHLVSKLEACVGVDVMGVRVSKNKAALFVLNGRAYKESSIAVAFSKWKNAGQKARGRKKTGNI